MTFAESAAQTIKETVPSSSSEAKGKAQELKQSIPSSGEAKGKAQELKGEAKGKAAELKGEAKAKTDL